MGCFTHADGDGVNLDSDPINERLEKFDEFRYTATTANGYNATDQESWIQMAMASEMA